ncbi:MAG: hypothetical protein V3U82_05950 [Robiginitomaculum sp.]
MKTIIFAASALLLAACSPVGQSDSASPADNPARTANQMPAMESAPFTLTIKGDSIDFSKELTLGELGYGKTHITVSEGNYEFDLNYKALPSNRSYPANLDINLKMDGKKRGYLFFAINDLRALKRMGVLGFETEIDGALVDVRLDFHSELPKVLRIDTLGDERLISDTLIGSKGFQMIRPMLLPLRSEGIRYQSYALDSHPFVMGYALRDLGGGGVAFEYDLTRPQESGEPRLAARFYYHAPNLSALREGMFAGKYFDADYGAIKLVYYPALGQTGPPQ